MGKRSNRSLVAVLSTGLLSPVNAVAQTTQPVDPQQLLNDLKGLHLPQEPAIWPPAPGWWMLALLGCVAFYYGYRWLIRRQSADKGYWRCSALDQQTQLRQKLDQGLPVNQVLAEASVLMRKVALVSQPRQQAAALHSESWLQLLNTLGNTDQYTEGVGRLLLTHPYRRHSDLDTQQVAALLALMRDTISNAPEVVVDA